MKIRRLWVALRGSLCKLLSFLCPLSSLTTSYLSGDFAPCSNSPSSHPTHPSGGALQPHNPTSVSVSLCLALLSPEHMCFFQPQGLCTEYFPLRSSCVSIPHFFKLWSVSPPPWAFAYQLPSSHTSLIFLHSHNECI